MIAYVHVILLSTVVPRYFSVFSHGIFMVCSFICSIIFCLLRGNVIIRVFSGLIYNFHFSMCFFISSRCFCRYIQRLCQIAIVMRIAVSSAYTTVCVFFGFDMLFMYIVIVLA